MRRQIVKQQVKRRENSALTHLMQNEMKKGSNSTPGSIDPIF